MDGQVRMALAGTEVELRPLQALRLLQARQEARELGATLAGDAAAERLVFAACVVAAGAYENERPLFETGRAALETLTAEELLLAASEYGDAAAPKWLQATGGTEAQEKTEQESGPPAPGAAPADAAQANLPPNALTGDSLADAGEKPVQPAFTENEKEEEMPGQKPEQLWNLDGQRPESGDAAEPVRTPPTQTARPQQAGAESVAPSQLYRRNDTGERPAGTQPAERVFLPEAASGQTGVNMQRVSSYFERDSRRYDGGFPCY